MNLRKWIYSLIVGLWWAGSAISADLPKITNDEEHNLAFKKGTSLISPVMALAGRQSKVTETNKNELKKGIEYLKAVVEYNPKNWAAYWFIGKAYQALNDSQDANKSFKTAYEIQSSNPDVAREYALSCINLGDGVNAIRSTETAIALSPNDAGLYANLALAYLIANQNQNALVAAKKSLEMNPSDKSSIYVKKLIEDVLSGAKPQPKSGTEF